MAKWLGFGLLFLLSFSIHAQDLVVTSYNGKTTFSQHEEFSASVTIKNDGIVPVTTQSSCFIYLSKDLTVVYGDGDKLVGTKYADDIDAGASLDLQFGNGLACDVPPGDYYLIIIADYYGSVQETNEQNNQHVVSNIAVGAPDVDWQFTSLSVKAPVTGSISSAISSK